MSRFIGEAEDFRQPGEPRRIIVTRDLLEELGVADSPRAEQECAVQTWLANNRPHQVLAISLREDGFLGENVSNNLSNEPRRTVTDDDGPSRSEQTADQHEHGRRRTTPDGRRPTSSGS